MSSDRVVQDQHDKQAIEAKLQGELAGLTLPLYALGGFLTTSSFEEEFQAGVVYASLTLLWSPPPSINVSLKVISSGLGGLGVWCQELRCIGSI